MKTNYTLFGDCRTTLRELPDQSVQMCVTSPPYYGLRDYKAGDLEIGKEQTPDEYIANLVEVFREVRRVLKNDGTLWLNIGDSYAGYHGNKNSELPTSSTNGWTNGYDENKRKGRPQDIGMKPKDLIGIPWMLAFALRADGWYLRQDIIWHKPNPMPESVKDRCTKAHEYVFLLSKSAKYFIDPVGLQEPAVQAGRVRNDKLGGNKGDDTHHSPGGQFLGSETRNKRSVWTVNTKPYKGAHFATFPPALIEPCILAGSRPGDIVLDPFLGSGTTGQVAQQHGRNWIGCELNQGYEPLQRARTGQEDLSLI